MKSLIEDFSQHLLDGLKTVDNASLSPINSEIENVLITGLGGSGIGATIVSELCKPTASIPVFVNKDYQIPGWVSKKTLVIACSYSGNTEETVEAVNRAIENEAQIVAITSGGKLEETCLKHKFDHLIIPGGNPPRSMLAYSLVCLFGLLENAGVINGDYRLEIEKSAALLDATEVSVRSQAEFMAKAMKNTTVCIYACEGMGGVATRWRQQLNENSKMLGWDAVIPEMNHNELVGWAGGSNQISTVFLKTPGDYERNKKRTELNVGIVQKHTNKVFEMDAKGGSSIQSALYLIHLGDWLSYYLQQENEVDIMDIKVIEYLKSELEKY